MDRAEMTLTDDSEKALEALGEAAVRALGKCGSAAEEHARENITRNGSVATGRLRDSITHAVDEAGRSVDIGTGIGYGVYVELGTGRYYPGGRQTPWAWRDSAGNWHRTHGQRPKPFIAPSVSRHIGEYRRMIEQEFSDKKEG